MKLPNNLGARIYLVLFGIFAASGMLSVFVPESDTYIYYNTLFRFYQASILWYLLAILDAILACFAVIPLACKTFGKPAFWTSLFRLLFILRLVTTLLGHNYELNIIKALRLGNPLTAWIMLGIWSLFVFPSFKEHFIYAFRKK